jgi:hypothetical protein
MNENHPKFAFMVVRLSGDRLVQISDRSFCKHAFTSINGILGPCAPCTDPGTGSVMGLGCYDVYGAGNNGDRFWLGPADEIDPWLGTWPRVGSYFDRGDPAVGGASATDGVRSLTSSMTNAMDVVKNRVTIKEQDLIVPGAQFFYQIQLLHQGEHVSRRGNNLRTRGVAFAWTGTSWNYGALGTSIAAGVLDRWSGATVNMAGNGADDGRFVVAVKVTGPTNGLWHWEYAVHNLDNNRGSAALRVPVCTGARVLNTGFRDIDGNALNEWTATVTGGELAFTAPASNPQNWNTLFNFWFDSDAAPVPGTVTIDQARLGPGALQVSVPSSVPGFVPGVWLGDGCGTPAVALSANGFPSIPNPAFGIRLRTAPVTGVFVFYSWNATSTPLGGGCTQYLDNAALGAIGFVITGAAGTVDVPLAIPAGLPPATLEFQAASLHAGGALMGAFDLSNGLAVRIGGTGCP